jgi:misacylated tRNA(Ala) deacylase
VRTVDLGSRDSYLRSTDATVLEVRDDGVVLDRTVFYARGGGQPGDTGSLSWDGGSARVTDTVKVDGEHVHVLDPEGGQAPPEGTNVVAEIDWERRYRMMRTHTALHALSGIIFSIHGAKVTGGNMGDDGTARMDFELDQLSQELGLEVEKELNARLEEDVPVNVSLLPRAEALADPDLIRTKVSLIPEWVDPIRVVDIVGIDKQADGGTHVRSTNEVGQVRIVKTESKGKGFKRMRIELDRP